MNNLHLPVLAALAALAAGLSSCRPFPESAAAPGDGAVDIPNVIVDTDLGSSVDDLFALDLAARLNRAGKINLLGVAIDRPDGCDPAGVGEFLQFADSCLNSIGLGDLPLGKACALSDPASCPIVINPYWTLIYSNDVAAVGFVPSGRVLSALPDAVSLYRRLLADAPDKSVVISSIGFFNNICALMESGPDEFSGMTGLELIAAKVKELRIMGGCYDGSVEGDRNGLGEYNVEGDIPSARKIFSDWPTQVICTPWEVGKKLEYLPEDVLADFPEGTESPVVRAVYQRWPTPPAGFIDRLWDVMTILPITKGDGIAPLSPCGKISVSDTGTTSFTPEPAGRHRHQIGADCSSNTVMTALRELYREGNRH